MDHLMNTLVPLRPETPTWERVFKTIEQNNIDDDKKKAWKEAVRFLFQEFGNSFFYNCGHNHPICIKLTTNLFLIEEIIDFSNALRFSKLADKSNYDILLKKLKPRIKSQSEGIPFSDILLMFSKEGFQVQFLEEAIGRKSADIQITDPLTKDSIFIEVSQLLQSPNQKEIQNQHTTLCRAFDSHGYDLPKVCKQLQLFEVERMEKIKAQIRKMKDQAADQKSFVPYEDEYIMMAVSHPSKLQALEDWCKARKLTRNSISGMNVDYNDTRRLVGNRKILAEIKQLPSESNGLIYIPISVLYFLSMNPADTIVSIMDQLVEFPHCLGVILFAPSVGSLFNEERKEVYHTMRSVKVVNGITRHLLFIGNPCFAGNVSESTFNKFKNSLY